MRPWLAQRFVLWGSVVALAFAGSSTAVAKTVVLLPVRILGEDRPRSGIILPLEERLTEVHHRVHRARLEPAKATAPPPDLVETTQGYARAMRSLAESEQGVHQAVGFLEAQLSAFRRHPSLPGSDPRVLEARRDTYLLLAQFFKMLGKTAEVRAVLAELVRIDSEARPSSRRFAPPTLREFETARALAGTREKHASLSITTRPRAAEIYVNGVPRGAWRASLRLPHGTHWVHARYRGVESPPRRVELMGDASLAIDLGRSVFVRDGTLEYSTAAERRLEEPRLAADLAREAKAEIVLAVIDGPGEGATLTAYVSSAAAGRTVAVRNPKAIPFALEELGLKDRPSWVRRNAWEVGLGLGAAALLGTGVAFNLLSRSSQASADVVDPTDEMSRSQAAQNRSSAETQRRWAIGFYAAGGATAAAALALGIYRWLGSDRDPGVSVSVGAGHVQMAVRF